MSSVPAWATWRVPGKPNRSCENLETASGFFVLQVDGVYTMERDSIYNDGVSTIETVDAMMVFIPQRETADTMMVFIP